MNGNQAEAGGGVPAFYQRKHGIYAFPCDAGAVLFDNGQLRISEIGDLPLTISAIIIVMTMLSIMKITKLYFPPAGALAILPLLIESGKLIVYPFVIIGGFVIFTVFAFIITKTPLNSLSK